MHLSALCDMLSSCAGDLGACGTLFKLLEQVVGLSGVSARLACIVGYLDVGSLRRGRHVGLIVDICSHQNR